MSCTTVPRYFKEDSLSPQQTVADTNIDKRVPSGPRNAIVSVINNDVAPKMSDAFSTRHVTTKILKCSSKVHGGTNAANASMQIERLTWTIEDLHHRSPRVCSSSVSSFLLFRDVDPCNAGCDCNRPSTLESFLAEKA
jgi:hypothetical protein